MSNLKLEEETFFLSAALVVAAAVIRIEYKKHQANKKVEKRMYRREE